MEKKGLVMLVIGCVLSLQAFSGIWYINPATGSDTNPGTSAGPFKTLLKASNVALPGDEIIIKNGTYTSFKDTYGTSGSTLGDGSSAAWITIRPETPGSVVLDATGAGCPGWNTPVIMLNEVRYVILRDFIIKNNSCGIGVWVSNCYFTTVKDNTIDNNYAHGILLSGEDITIDGNTVSNNVKNNANGNYGGGGWNQAIGSWAINNVNPNLFSKRIKYINNRVFDNWGEGMILLMVQDGLMEGNTVYNNFSTQLYSDNSRDVVIRNNHAYVTTELYNRPNCCGRPAGITFAVEPAGQGYPLSQNADNIIIYNNIVSGTGWGLNWFNYGAGSYSNIQVYHNVFHDIRNDYTISINSAGSGVNVLRNNIIYKGATAPLNIAGAWTLSNNAYPDGIPTSGVGTNGVGTNNLSGAPGFVVASPNGSVKTDFRLSTTSPLAGAGYGVSAIVPNDFWGTTRSSTPSIGVHEVSGSNLRTPENPANPVNGLEYAYYEGDWSVLPNFDALTALKTGVSNTFDLSPRNRDDYFGFRYKGFINIPSDGTYTFYTSSDDGSKLYIGSTEVVNNDGLHGSVERSGTIGLKAGKHAITVIFFEKTGGQTLTVSYSGPSLSKTIIPASALFRSPATGSTGTGLSAIYFDNKDFTGTQLSRTDETINFDWQLGAPTPAMGVDQFSVRWTGQVEPLYSETYTFYTTSDDGVKLWVNNQLLIDNWVDQAPTEKSGSISLSAGNKYEIKMEYYENGGGAAAKLFWSSNSQSKEIIPKNRLHAGTQALRTTSFPEDLEESALMVYPVPADNFIFIKQAGFSLRTDFKLMDVTGREVKSVPVSKDADTFKLDVSHLKGGIYLLQIRENQHVQKQKILIKRN